MSGSSSEVTSFDIGRERVGAVYAKGLLGATEAAHVTERVLEELRSLLDDVLARLPDFAALLASPRVGVAEKQAILDRAFAGKMAPLLLNFLKVVADHRRLDCLPEIRCAAEHLHHQVRGRVEVAVRTAEPLSRGALDQVQARLTRLFGRQVVITTTVEPGLIGGLVVRVGDTVFDGSLRHRLDRLRADTISRTEQVIRESLQRFLVADR
ncbi:MAG: ATP synthase F1 subunit delta [Planctomycetes bacterium]|nr:ATP synthase F1 subunit delta [Planctomycetota bacterium]